MISTSCFLPVYRENKNREKTGQPKKELPRFFILIKWLMQTGKLQGVWLEVFRTVFGVNGV